MNHPGNGDGNGPRTEQEIGQVQDMARQRVSHPQTNGKIERLHRTLEDKLPLFDHENESCSMH